MKLKKSRQVRSCQCCGAVIAKGDQYGMKSILFGGKATPHEKESARERCAVLIESVRVSVPYCAVCANYYPKPNL
jgi:hypothetical protein